MPSSLRFRGIYNIHCTIFPFFHISQPTYSNFSTSEHNFFWRLCTRKMLLSDVCLNNIHPCPDNKENRCASTANINKEFTGFLREKSRQVYSALFTIIVIKFFTGQTRSEFEF